MTVMTSLGASEEETRISFSDQAPGVDPSLTPPGGCGSGEVGWGGGAHFSSVTVIAPRPDGRRFITSSALLPSLFRLRTHSTHTPHLRCWTRFCHRGDYWEGGGGSGAVGVGRGRTDCTGWNVSRGD